MKKSVGIFLLAGLTFVFAAAVRAQSQNPAAASASMPASPAEPPEAAPQAAAPPAPALRTELIKLKYADLETITILLRGYQSALGRVMPAGRAEKSIVVTDTPEIVEKMISIVRDIDIKPTEIQYTVQIVQGSDAGEDTLKNDAVIRELRGILKYKSFVLLDGTVIRVIDGETAQAKIGPKGEYEVWLRPKYTKDGTVETIQTEIRLGRQEWNPAVTVGLVKKEEAPPAASRFNELIRTTLLLKAGEKTVVGVSKTDADRGLILILYGKAVK